MIWAAKKPELPVDNENDSKNLDSRSVEIKESKAEEVGDAVTPNDVQKKSTNAAHQKRDTADTDADTDAAVLAKKERLMNQAILDAIMGDGATQEDALGEVNKGVTQYKLDADNKLVPIVPPKDSEDHIGDTKDVQSDEPGEGKDNDGKSIDDAIKNLPEADQNIVKTMVDAAMESGKVIKEVAVKTAIALLAIIKAMENFQKGKKTEAPATAAKDAAPVAAPVPKVSDDTKPAPKDAPAKSPDKLGADVGVETVQKSLEAEETDITKVQNPKEEADKIRASAEKLNTRMQEINTKLAEHVEDNDVDADERAATPALHKELAKVEGDIKAIEAKAVPFDDELERRANIVSTTWENAEKVDNGLISGVSLDTADGDNVVIEMADASTVKLAEEAINATELSFKTEGNKIIMEDVDVAIINDEGKLTDLMDALAKIPSPAVADSKEEKEDDGDLSNSKEGIPDNIEKMVKSLNAKRLELVASNTDFMKEAPIGKVFEAMTYKIADDGVNITINIPNSVSAEYRSIMKANGRKVEGEVPNYTVAYPGETITMGEQGGNYPSRLAWGGVEGRADTQFTRAVSGMAMWESSISPKLPANIPSLAVSGEEAPELDEADPKNTDNIKKVQDALGGLQNGLTDAAGKTHFGKFIASLKVEGTVGGEITLSSSALEGKTFAHMANQIGLADHVSKLTGSQDSGYTMVLKPGAAKNLVHNLGRWAAMMGGKAEKTPDSEEGSGESTDETLKSSEQVKKDYKNGINDITADVGKMREYLSTDSGNSYEGFNEDGSIDSESELGKMLTVIKAKIDNLSFQVPDDNALDADLIVSLSTAGHTDKILTGVDQGYQIIMGESGVGVERIQPEATPASAPDISPERLSNLTKWAENLNERADTIKYNVDVSVDTKNGRILITAENDTSEILEKGKGELLRVEKEANPRVMDATWNKDKTVLSLNILAKDAEHGYLGEITRESFSQLPEEQKKSDSLGPDGKTDT